jgi:hypothetical protein
VRNGGRAIVLSAGLENGSDEIENRATMTNEKNQPRQITFTIIMDDGSIFNVPPAWNDLLYIKYGDDAQQLTMLKKNLTYITKKYYRHCAWPSKFDGLIFGDPPEGYDPDSLSRYDYDEYYGEQWGEAQIGISKTNPPSMSQIAEAVLYQSLRVLIMQQALKGMGSNIQVITLDDIESGRNLPEP